MLKLSVGGYSFSNTMSSGKMDVFGYLETIRYRYGLQTVDLWNGQFCKWETHGWVLPEKEQLAKIREALDERDMRLINIAVDSAHIWDADPEKREWFYRNAIAHIKAAAALGAGSIRLDTGGHGQDSFTQEQFDLIVERFREYSDLANEYGMRIGPENHMGPSLIPQVMKDICEAVGRPNFGILLHMGRWNKDKETGDDLVAPYTYHTHMDPSSAASPDSAARIQRMKENGYTGYWGVEFNARHNQYTEVEWLLASVKRLLAASESN